MEVERNLMRLASLSVTLVVLLAIIGCGGGSAGGGDSGKDLLQEVKDRGVHLGLPQLAQYAPGGLQGLFILGTVTSGVLALGINYGAYMAEIFRAGIQSVGHGQVEAAQALGMTRAQTMRRIVLPQAIRVIIPPTGNEFIAMLKDSSLLGIVGTQELFFRASKIGRQYFQNLETLVVAALIYWALTSLFSYFQGRLERRLSKGYVRDGGPHGH
jgi:ABC-type amino acid transport system permease subunit